MISLGGGSTKSTTDSSGTRNQKSGNVSLSSKGGATASTQGQKGAKSSTGTEAFSILGERATSDIGGVLSSLAGASADTVDTQAARATAQGQVEVLNFLRERASTADSARMQSIQDVVAAERLRGEEQLGQQLSVLASQVGSRGNTIFQGLASQGIGDLRTKLAGVGGALNLQARNDATAEIMGTIDAGSRVGSDFTNVAQAVNQNEQTRLGGIAALGNVLKGASGTSTKTSADLVESLTSQNTTSQELASLIDLGITDLDFTEKSKTKGTKIGFGFEL